MFKRFQGWFIDRQPIQSPDLLNLNIQEFVNDFGTTGETIQLKLYFPLASIFPTEVLLKTTAIYPANLTDLPQQKDAPDNRFHSLNIPVIEEKPFPKLENIPQTINMLEVLGAPKYAGKAYGEGGTEPKVVQGELPFSPSTYDKSICRHGHPRYECGICEEEDEKRRNKRNPFVAKVKTANVFDLLLPFLQPPFEHMLDQPLLFPPGLKPFDYQVIGIRFLIERHTALLGDDMGLGKTIQTIFGIRILVRQRKVNKVLIVCPLSLLGQWEREIKKWAPELYVSKVRGVKELRDVLWKNRSIVYLTTYETLRDDTNRNLVSGETFSLVILDEIQRIKNPDTAISRAVRRLEPEYRWGLSGTPLENKLEDVTAIFRFLSPKMFKLDKEYSSTQVRQMIKPYFLRRRIQDVKHEIPDKYVSEIWLDLNDTQRQAYDNLLAEAKTEISRPGITRIHIFALLNQLKQICNLEPDSGDSCKADYLQNELAEIIDGNYKALIFSQFPQKTLVEIKQRFIEYEPEIIHGGLSSNQREKILNDFQESGAPKILLASIKAAGVGLNLTRANYVFHFDHWWNPAIARQAEARAWRIGQQLPVFVHDIYTNDTVEERIYRILAEKQILFDEVIDNLSSEYVQAAFSDEDLYKIFDLEKPITLRTAVPARPQIGGHSIDHLAILTPNQFEHIVAVYYQKLNFKVEVTGGAHDRGVDIVARRISDLGEEYLIVQCKHYPKSIIGPNIVRELIGTRQSQPDATRAVLVTSGTFSTEAINLAKKYHIDMIDGNFLITLLNRYQIQITF